MPEATTPILVHINFITAQDDDACCTNIYSQNGTSGSWHTLLKILEVQG